MDDKDVGELWSRAKLPAVIDLICKLIEERANAYRASVCGYCAETGDTQRASETAIPNACRDFGINHAEYEEVKR